MRKLPILCSVSMLLLLPVVSTLGCKPQAEPSPAITEPETEPTSPPTAETAEQHNTRGIALAEEGEHEHAIAEFSKAIEVDPKLAKAHYNRGLTYFEKGEFDKAIADFNEAIEVDPKFAKAYYNRGTLHAARGEVAKAVSDLEKFIELSDDPALVQAAERLLDKLR